MSTGPARPLDARGPGDHHDPVAPRWLVRAGWTGWRQELGWTLVGLSVLMLFGACFFGTGPMPYQDEPTPEMLATQAREVHDGRILLMILGPAGVASLVGGILLIVRGRRLRRGAEQHP